MFIKVTRKAFVIGALAWLLFGLSSLSSSSALNAQGQPVVRIALREEVKIDDDIVTLGELATLQGGDANVRRQMSQLDLAITSQSPDATIELAEARARLLIAGFTSNDFDLTGSIVRLSQSNSVNTANSFQQPAIVSGIVAHVARGLQQSVESIEVELLSQPSSVLPEIRSGYRFEPLDHADRMIGRRSLTIGIFDGEQMLEKFRIMAKTTIQRTVLVAKRPIEKGERLTIDNCYQDRRPFENMNSRNGLTSESLGSLTTRRIRSQDMIRKNDIEDPERVADRVVVRARDQVIGVANKGGLKITMSGMEVMKPGKVGDVVPLRNPVSKKVVYGRIIDASRVQIQF